MAVPVAVLVGLIPNMCGRTVIMFAGSGMVRMPVRLVARRRRRLMLGVPAVATVLGMVWFAGVPARIGLPVRVEVILLRCTIYMIA